MSSVENRRAMEFQLADLIGKPALIRLAEEFGGTRLYMPVHYMQAGRIIEAVGQDAARIMSERFGSDVIRVPICRELRADHYRAQGDSQAKIARKLGLTESGVYRLLKRPASDAQSEVAG